MLTPNGPKERIEYVIKTYRDTKNRRIIPEAVMVSLALLGYDRASTNFERTYRPLWHYLFAEYDPPIVAEMRADNFISDADMPPDEETIEEFVSATFDEMPGVVLMLAPGVSEPHQSAFLIPWIARELGRLSKAMRRGQATGADFERAVEILRRKAPAIAMWADQEGVDITQTSLAEALEAVRDYEADSDAVVTQGAVVYEWPDGWTIQSLDEGCLSDEGEIMQHCVGGGGYASAVERNETFIYSLRDPKGRPHATMELELQTTSKVYEDVVSKMSYEEARDIFNDPVEFLRSPLAKLLTFEQIRGKQNDMPAVKYRERIQEFIRDCFNSDPLGMLMVAMPGQQISFQGHTIIGVNFGDDIAMEGVPLDQAKWAGGIYYLCEWPDIDRGDFRGASFRECDFETVENVNFDKATFGRYARIRGDIVDCSFRYARFDQADLSGGDTVKDCDFTQSDWRASDFGPYIVENCDFTDVVVEDSDWRGLVMSHVDFTGFTIKNTDMEPLKLDNADLRGTSHRVISILLDEMGVDPASYVAPDGDAARSGVILPADYELPDEVW